MLADCLGDHGPLSKEGVATVAGRTAVVLRDSGASPSLRPDRIFVALDSPHVVLRLTSAEVGKVSGPSVHGNCPVGFAPNFALGPGGSDMAFSNFDARVTAQPPSDVINWEMFADS
jgi:hypothetical protein